MTTPASTPTSAPAPKTKLSGKVVKISLQGALLDIGQPLPGVLHISQLRREPVNKIEEVLQVGQTVDVWVRRVKPDRIELTMIEPLQLEWSEIKPEMVVKGKVVRLESYGAFVEIGAERPGMVHVSEMAVGYVKSPADVVKEGDEVEAIVLDVDRKKKQIRLSMKALQARALAEARAAAEEQKARRGKREKGEKDEPSEPQHEPELTAMQIAFREAQERARSQESAAARPRRSKGASPEQEEIQRRTLEKRVTQP